MPIHLITCPKCDTLMRSQEGLADDALITCSKCHTTFMPADAAAAVAGTASPPPATPTTPPPAPEPPPAAVSEEPTEPAKRKQKKKRKPETGGIPWPVRILISLAVIGVGTSTGLYILWPRTSPKSDTVAEADNDSLTDRETTAKDPADATGSADGELPSQPVEPEPKPMAEWPPADPAVAQETVHPDFVGEAQNRALAIAARLASATAWSGPLTQNQTLVLFLKPNAEFVIELTQNDSPPLRITGRWRVTKIDGKTIFAELTTRDQQPNRVALGPVQFRFTEIGHLSYESTKAKSGRLHLIPHGPKMALLPEREPPVLMRASPRPRGSAQTPPPGTEEVVLTKLPGGALATFPRKPLRIDRPASAVEYQVSDDLDAQFGTWIEPLPRRIAADAERGFLEKMYEKNRSDNRKSEMTLPHFQAAGEHVSMEYTVTQGTFPYERRVEHVREKYRYVFTVRGYHETDVTRREADQFLSSVKLPEPWVRAPLGEKASVIFPERPDTQSSQQDFTLRASLSKSVTFEASLNFLNRSFTPKQVRPILQERINDEIRRKVFPQIRKPEFRESQGHTSCDYTIQMMDKRWKRMVTHVRGKLAYTVSVIALSEKDLNTPEANQFLNSLEIVN